MYNSTTNSLVKGSGWGRRTYVDKYENQHQSGAGSSPAGSIS